MNKDKLNSFLWSIVIFIKYVLLPLNYIFSTQYIEYIFVLSVVLISVKMNGINKVAIRTILFLVLFFIIDILIFNNIETLTFFFVQMVSSSLLMFFMSTQIKNIEYFFEMYYKVSMFTLLTVSTYLLGYIITTQSIVSYMAIGNVMTYITIPVLYVLLFSEHKKMINFTVLIYILIICLFFANRMAIFTIFIICNISLIVFSENLKQFTKRYFLLVGEILVLILLLLNINLITETVNKMLMKTNFSFYALVKFQRMMTNAGGVLEGLINSSSGRDNIYKHASLLIREANYLPRGISGFYHVLNDGTFIHYPHNFFLELLINFGIFGILVLIFYLYFFIKAYKVGSKPEKFLLLTLLLFSVSRLLVSSSVWLSTSLWSSIGFMIIILKRKEA